MLNRCGLIILAWLSLLVLGGCSESDWTTLSGQNDSWSSHKDRIIVVNLWADWCAPCRDEIPQLNALYQQQDAMGIALYGLHYDRPDGETLASQVEAMAIEFPVMNELLDPQLIALWPQVLPSTYLFKDDGELVKTLVGPQTRDSLLAAVKELN